MKNERGITLLVLIISIIVMIILAGIVINIALGDNGIFRGANTAQIMSKVEALDDAIKAYTMKNNDPYSSSKKTIDDLLSEGILKKITLVGEDATNDEDDKIIYYVNFENTELEVAQALGLKSEDYENLEKLTSFTYTNLSELQNKGIYVIDNDLNAAYLKNERTYGTLTNFGEKDKIEVASEYASQKLLLQVNPEGKIIEQEVILIIDRTVSMALADNVAEADDIALIMNSDGTVNYEASYNKTRWAGVVNALDSFADIYFNKCPNGKMTIYTFYGTDDNTINLLGECKDAQSFKALYANIFSQEQFTVAVSNLINKYQQTGSVATVNKTFFPYNRTYYSYFGVIRDWYSTTYEIDCRFSNGMNYPTLYAGATPATLGNSTCAPNALYKVYTERVLRNQKNSVATNVVIMTDGDSNQFWGACSGGKNTIGTVSRNIVTISIDTGAPTPYNFGVYAVGFGGDAGGFKATFGSRGNYTEFYNAEDSEQLKDRFSEIANTVGEKLDTQTDANSSHTIQTKTAGGTNEDYKIKNAYKIVLSLRKSESETSDSDITLEFQEGATGVGGVYDLSEIYNKETGIISLEKAWQIWEGWTGLNPSDLDGYEYKVISIYTN